MLDLGLIAALPLLAIPFYYISRAQHPFVRGVPDWVLSSLLVSAGLSAAVAFGAQRLWQH